MCRYSREKFIFKNPKPAIAWARRVGISGYTRAAHVKSEFDAAITRLANL